MNVRLLNFILMLYMSMTHEWYFICIIGKRDWVGHNAWVNLPVVKVALGVNSKDLVAWVLDRMGR